MRKKLSKMLFNKSGLIRNALQQLNQPPSGGSLLIINDNNQLCGVLTDGDIRRALLKNKSLETPISEIINSDYTFIFQSELEIGYIKSLAQKIRFLPVVNENNEVVDCLFFEYRSPIPIAKPLFFTNHRDTSTDDPICIGLLKINLPIP